MLLGDYGENMGRNFEPAFLYGCDYRIFAWIKWCQPQGPVPIVCGGISPTISPAPAAGAGASVAGAAASAAGASGVAFIRKSYTAASSAIECFRAFFFGGSRLNILPNLD